MLMSGPFHGVLWRLPAEEHVVAKLAVHKTDHSNRAVQTEVFA